MNDFYRAMQDDSAAQFVTQGLTCSPTAKAIEEQRSRIRLLTDRLIADRVIAEAAADAVFGPRPQSTSGDLLAPTPLGIVGAISELEAAVERIHDELTRFL